MHLDAHNKYRAMHQVEPMVIDEDLAKGAQAYAEKLNASGEFKHSDSPFGENLAMHGNPTVCLTTTHATDAWYKEVDNYDFGTYATKGGMIGHFTQVVWKGSTKLGMGVAGTIMVGRYSPAGNMIGSH